MKLSWGRLRQQSLISRHLSKIILSEMHDECLTFLSIREVILSADGSWATVYYRPITDQYAKHVYEQLLENKKKEIRYLLSKKLTTYKSPQLRFVYDNLSDYANRIETIITKANTKNDK